MLLKSLKTIVDGASSAPAKSSLKANLVLGGKYILKTYIAEGGMGEVWCAWDNLGKRYVALKFIKECSGRMTKETLRMQETFRLTDELNHQNICPNYGLEFDKKHGLYLAMKWLNGFSLQEILEYIGERRRNEGRRARFPRPVALKILRDVAAALDYSHRKGIIHRDVKPSNIFLEVKRRKVVETFLIDFGLASIVYDSAFFEQNGTLPYMPPEQWLGRTQDGRTDQYSLAVVAYQLYAGCLPFSQKSQQALRCAVLNETPAPIEGVPDEVNEALRRGLAKSKSDRYESCSAFIRELEKASEKIQYDDGENETIDIPKKGLEFQADQGDLKEKTGFFERIGNLRGYLFATKALAKVQSANGKIWKNLILPIVVILLLLGAIAFLAKEIIFKVVGL